MISICEWSTYKKSRCRRNVFEETKLCPLHTNFIKDFSLDSKENNVRRPCCIESSVKFIPRTHKFLTHMLKTNDIDETYVDIILPGSNNVFEEADISNEEYIEIISDETKYYYEPIKGQLKTKHIKIVLNKSCSNVGEIEYKNSIYCKECYEKIGSKYGFPLYSIIKEHL